MSPVRLGLPSKGSNYLFQRHALAPGCDHGAVLCRSLLALRVSSRRIAFPPGRISYVPSLSHHTSYSLARASNEAFCFCRNAVISGKASLNMGRHLRCPVNT
jgi:hypothetical protein